MDRKYPKGSSLALGIVVGGALGLLMDDFILYTVLGIMFGLIGEEGNNKKGS